MPKLLLIQEMRCWPNLRRGSDDQKQLTGSRSLTGFVFSLRNFCTMLHDREEEADEIETQTTLKLSGYFQNALVKCSVQISIFETSKHWSKHGVKISIIKERFQSCKTYDRQG